MMLSGPPVMLALADQNKEATPMPESPLAGLSMVNEDCSDPPAWPDVSSTKRYHLDLQVDDLAHAEAACRDLGAGFPAFQPGADRLRVLTDPAGHRFCLSARQAGS